MISEKDKQIIIQCASKYGVSYILLFGSSLMDNEDFNDIDIAVKGIESKMFFKFYAELYKKLSKTVDLVDLSDKSLFNELIEERGVRIYG